MKVRILFPLLLFFALTACVDNPGIEPDPTGGLPANPDPWELSTEFDSRNESALRAAVQGDQLLVLGDHMVAKVGRDHRIFHVNFPGTLDQLSLPMTGHFLPLYEEGRSISFFTASRTANSDFVASVALDSIHPDLLGFPPFAWTHVFAAHEEANQMIAPFQLADGSNILVLFQVEMEDISGNNELVVKEVTFKIIEIPFLERITFTQALAEGFLISYDAGGKEQTSFIDHDGSITPVLDKRLGRGIFPVQDSWYGFREASDMELFRSDDGGKTWIGQGLDLYESGLGELVGLMGHAVIEGRTFLFDAYRMYEIREKEVDTFELTILDDEGLNGSVLLEVIRWQDKVYACTTSGLYTKSLGDFYAPLKP